MKELIFLAAVNLSQLTPKKKTRTISIRVLKYFKAVEAGGDLNSIEFFEPIIHVLHNFSEQKVTKEELKEANEMQLKILPDLQNRILDIFGKNDKVVVRRLTIGTHVDKDKLLGIPGTGKKIAYEVMDIFRFENNKIVEMWHVYDLICTYGQYGLIQQLPGEMISFPAELEKEPKLNLDFDNKNVKENVKSVKSFYNQVWNKQNICILEHLIDFKSYMSADFPTPLTAYTLENTEAAFKSDFQIVPDVKYTVNDVIAAGDKVAVRWLAKGTYQYNEKLFGVKGTGKPIMSQGITIFQIANGKIIRTWIGQDNLHLLGQYGTVSLPANYLTIPE